MNKKQIRSGAMWLFCAGLLVGISVPQAKTELLIGGLAIGAIFAGMGFVRLSRAVRREAGARHQHECAGARSTVGGAFDEAIERVTDEMNAGRAVLAGSEPLPDGLNRFDVMTGHLIEAADAFLEVAGAAGVDRKLVVLEAAAARHNIHIFSMLREPGGKERGPWSWIEHAYPLQSIRIELHGTRHHTPERLLGLLETVKGRILGGDVKGEDSDDDYGYRFSIDESMETVFKGPATHC